MQDSLERRLLETLDCTSDKYPIILETLFDSEMMHLIETIAPKINEYFLQLTILEIYREQPMNTN